MCSVTAGAWLHAYTLSGVTWGTSSVNYYVNPNSKWMSQSAAISAVQTGAAAWDEQSQANIRLLYAGTTSGSTLGMNYKSEVFFRDGSNGAVAEGYYWYDGTGKIVDGDIVFWEGTVPFFFGSGCSNGVYTENVATHEFGHVLGLLHSAVSTATMYPSMASYCDRSWMTLDGDDVAAIERAYPPGSGGAPNTAPSISISSPLNSALFSDSAAITFSGAASDAQDGNLTSSLKWTSNLMFEQQIGTGGSFTRTLPAGVHIITATATDHGGLTGSELVTITVSIAPPSGGVLQVRAYKVRGFQQVDLTWSGISAAMVDIHRNGEVVATVANIGARTESLNQRGAGSYTYQVCAAGTSTCTNSVTASF